MYNQRVFTDYLDAAMHTATYEFLEDSREYYGEVPACQGVWATAATLEGCRDELRDVLESWILFRIAAHMSLPTVSGVELAVPEVA